MEQHQRGSTGTAELDSEAVVLAWFSQYYSVSWMAWDFLGLVLLGVSSVSYVAWLLGWCAASDSRFHLPELRFPSPKNVMHKIATFNSLTILLSLNEHPLGYHFNEIHIVVEIHKSRCENSWYGIKKEDFGFTPWCGVDVMYRVLCIDWIICIVFEAILFAATLIAWFLFVWFFSPRYENFQRRLTQNPLFWKT